MALKITSALFTAALVALPLSALAGDFFGTPNGPGLGAAPGPSQPEEIPVPVPGTPPPKAKPAKPVKPVKRTETPAPAEAIAPTTPLPPFLQALGPAQNHLRAWFSFNSREQGGLTWSAQPLAATLSPTTALKDAGGQRFADFSASTSLLSFTTPLPLGPRYTLAAWVSFPVRNKATAVLFRGSGNDLLNLHTGGLFGCEVKWKALTFTEAGVPQSGWHHLAVTADGTQTLLYIDGRLAGTIAAAGTDDLASVGNHTSEYYQTASASMDDVAIFNRELTDVEVAKLALLRGPTSMSSSSLAGKAPFKSSLDQGPKPSALGPSATPIAATLPAATPVSSLPARIPSAPPVATLPALPPVAAAVPRVASTPSPASPLAGPVPPFVQALGPMQTDLKAWYSFNSREKGGAAWSTEPMGAVLSPAALLKDTGGQRVVDLSAEGAVMTFGTPITLGPRYTLAAWVLFPIRNKNISILFRGSRSDFLNVQPTGLFGCWNGGRTLTYGDAAAPTTGWHHVALTVDGKQSFVFVDGRLQGSLPVASADDLATIGNHPAEYEQSSMMSAAMDDIAIFTRDLSDAEIFRLAQVRCATTIATSGATSPMVPFKSSLDQPAKPKK
jgi:hypothetical protein